MARPPARELEIDLIAAHVLATLELPIAQFISGKALEPDADAEPAAR